MTLFDVLNELGVALDDRANRKINIIKKRPETIKYTSGGCKSGYHGYVEGYTLCDPYNQLKLEKEEDDLYCSFTWRTKNYYTYSGEKSAAVFWRYEGINNSERGIDIYLPEGTEVVNEAQCLGTLHFKVPERVYKKFIREACEREGRNPKCWYKYARVSRIIERKALVYAAYQFAKAHPDKVGLIDPLCTYTQYSTIRNDLVTYGTSVLILNGNVCFVDYNEITPKKLIAKYNVVDYFEVDYVEP